jgi:YD repeat-containing protein
LFRARPRLPCRTPSRPTPTDLPNGVTTGYAYDAGSRLTSLTYTLATSTLGTLQYSYDASGNRSVVGGTWARTGLPLALEAATYNAANRQLTFGTQALTYDFSGNLTSDGTSTSTCDARDRLIHPRGHATTYMYETMDWVASRTDSLSRSSASPAREAPSAWAHVVGRYLEALRVTHYAADTVHVRTLYLKYFTAWATARGIAKPEDVTRADVERYQIWLYHYRQRTGGPLSVWSQHGRLVAVKGLFRWLAKQRVLSANPAAELELPRVTAQRLPQPLTDTEISQVPPTLTPRPRLGCAIAPSWKPATPRGCGGWS